MTYDIFISYKRGGSSSATAAYLYDLLTKKGYSVFFDRKEIRQGQFNTQLLEHIENATDIIVLLDDHSLKACFSDIKDTYKTDWFCMEVMHSLLKQKRIIPLLLEGYCMPDAEQLPDELKALSMQNAISLDISDIEDFYKKYLIDQEYLASKPRNLYLSQTKGEGVADFLFYSDGDCDLFECGNLIGTLNINIDEDHPYRHPVQRCGEHRFLCRNNDTCEEQRITALIDVNSQKYISIKWTAKQNLWELSEDDIQKQNDSLILFAWGKGLFEGTSKHDPNTKLSFLCLKEAANKWNIDARNFIVDHVKGLFATDLTIEDRIAWYEKAIEFDSADAYEILGRYYDVGIDVKQDINKALEYGNKALQLRIEKYGEMNADVAMSYHNLGRASYSKGDVASALHYYKKAIEIRVAIYGDEHPELAKSYAHIGEIYRRKGDYDKALEYHLKALEIRERVLGKEHPDTALSYSGIGDVYKNRCDYDKALEYHLKALEVREKAHGKDHPNTASSYNNIGGVYYDKGDYDKALEFYLKALEVGEKALGKENYDTAQYNNNIGCAYRNKGDYDKALEYYLKALGIKEKVIGKDHINTIMSYNNIGDVYNDKGDYDKALEYYLKALGIREKVLGKEHPDTAVSYYNIGNVYLHKGDYDKALEYHLKTLEVWGKVLGKEHPNTAASYYNIGNVYLHKGDNDKALEYYLKALWIREKMLGKEHPDTMWSYNNIAWTYHLMGKYDEALPYAEKAVKASPGNSGIIDTLATVYQGLGRYDEALEQFELCLKLMKEHNAPDDSIRETEEKIAALKNLMK